MSKAVTLNLTPRELEQKAQADRYLTETLKILKQLAAERQRKQRRRSRRTNIVTEVKTILRGA